MLYFNQPKPIHLMVLFALLFCPVLLSAQGTNCENDVVPPTPICLNGLQATADPADGLVLWPQDFDAGSWDDCDGGNLSLRIILEDESTGNPPSNTFLQLPPAVAIYPVEVWFGDQSGNWSFCTTFIEITGLAENPDCDNDTTAPVAVCNANLIATAHPVDGITIWALDIDEGSWDNCSGLEYRIQRADDFDGNPPSTESLYFPPENATLNVVLWVGDASDNWNSCFTELEIRHFTSIIGQLYIDSNNNCDYDDDEDTAQLAGWEVVARIPETGDFVSTTTQSGGFYNIVLPATWEALGVDEFEVELLPPGGLPFGGCPTVYTVEGYPDPYTIVNFGLTTIDDCLLTTVDVSTPLLRRCFVNTYTVNYSNFSSILAENALVQVVIDPFMDFVNAGIPFTDLGDGAYEFSVGDLEGGESGQFWFQVMLSCEAEIGMTHCVSATITPFSCILPGPSWSGAELTVEGECDESEGLVRFTVTNTGSSSMIQSPEFRVVEDVVMYMQEELPALAPAQSEEYTYPANGATWRWAVPQVPDHPDGGVAAAFVEGCGGLSTGMVNLFPLSDDKPNFSLDCQENVGSWDPNDKQAFPAGYGEQHFIEANTDIEYKIRFQNTGTDTAFTVRIEDQLSPELEWQSITPGAASHTYRMSLHDDGLLEFHFDNIMLPDSNVNEPASHGFVKFRVKQQADLMDGTLIENTADIYFDFNEAVVTNTVEHTVGTDFLLVRSQSPTLPGLRLQISPNPMQDRATFQLLGYELQEGGLQLYDQYGRLVVTHRMLDQQLTIQRGDLAAGLYFYQLYDKEQLLISGKVLVH